MDRRWGKCRTIRATSESSINEPWPHMAPLTGTNSLGCFPFEQGLTYLYLSVLALMLSNEGVDHISPLWDSSVDMKSEHVVQRGLSGFTKLVGWLNRQEYPSNLLVKFYERVRDGMLWHP